MWRNPNADYLGASSCCAQPTTPSSSLTLPVPLMYSPSALYTVSQDWRHKCPPLSPHDVCNIFYQAQRLMAPRSDCTVGDARGPGSPGVIIQFLQGRPVRRGQVLSKQDPPLSPAHIRSWPVRLHLPAHHARKWLNCYFLPLGERGMQRKRVDAGRYEVQQPQLQSKEPVAWMVQDVNVHPLP